MATYIRTIKDPAGNQILPRTRADAVTMADDSGLEVVITDLKSNKIILTDEVLTEAMLRDADTLDGQLPSFYGNPPGLDAGTGINSIVEGLNTIASGFYSHAEGEDTLASGSSSHAEGYNTIASGNNSHAEGFTTIASGTNSHAEGYMCEAQGNYSHSQGYSSKVIGDYSHAEGKTTLAGRGYFYEINSNSGSDITMKTTPSGFAVNDTVYIPYFGGSGYTTASAKITAINGLVVSLNNTAVNSYAKYLFKSGVGSGGDDGAHSEGFSTVAYGCGTHAEGAYSVALGAGSHAEGISNTASGSSSHAEGGGTYASGNRSHAEGEDTLASNNNSHAEGYLSVASGAESHAQNCGTIAQGQNQTAIGKYNIADSTSAFIIGKGLSDGARSNALIIDWNGVMQYTGSPTVLHAASYTLALSDIGTVQKCLSASAIVITIPLDATLNFPINTEIVVFRYGAGTVTVAGISGVTVNSSGGKKAITNQFESITMKKMAANEWILIGSLSA